MRLFCGLNKAIDLFLSLSLMMKAFSEGARMQFDELSAHFGRGFDFGCVRSYEQADLNSRVVQSFACFRQRASLGGGVQPPLGRDLLPPLRHEANDIRLDP